MLSQIHFATLYVHPWWRSGWGMIEINYNNIKTQVNLT